MASAFVGGVVSAPYIERKYSWHYGYVKMYEINRGIKNKYKILTAFVGSCHTT